MYSKKNNLYTTTGYHKHWKRIYLIQGVFSKIVIVICGSIGSSHTNLQVS